MAKRQKILAQILSDNGVTLHYPFDFDRSIFYDCRYNRQILALYKELGGVMETYPIGFGDFDIITDRYFIELDEENHFNRYRAITIKSDFYKDWSTFSTHDYLQYCRDFEYKCSKGGNFWSSNNSEKQFGVSSDYGNLHGNGPSRWKQRAFYDFLRDVYSYLQNKPIYRISIYDKVGSNSINTILEKQKTNSYKAIYELIINRNVLLNGNKNL